MKTALLMAPACQLNTLENLFIEMTAKNCNQRCKHCYIDFPLTKNVKDFISSDIIQEALSDIDITNLKCIYLTGAEPMTHPDFNSILRLCLKYSNVCICTNGSFINEKKSRFLRRVQDESVNEIIFKLSLAHYDENMNDSVRCRGNYRQVLFAIKYLVKYGFNPILEVTNYYNESEDVIRSNFISILHKSGFDAQDRNVVINRCYKVNDANYVQEEYFADEIYPTDCKFGRIITARGVYACPFLANDHRGRCGSTLKDYSTRVMLETEYCNTCLSNKRQVFSIDFSEFNN
jgi:pyruvate-formate lyase-activating enzyme